MLSTYLTEATRVFVVPTTHQEVLRMSQLYELRAGARDVQPHHQLRQQRHGKCWCRDQVTKLIISYQNTNTNSVVCRGVGQL